MDLNDLLFNIGGFIIGMLAGILFITNLLVTIFFQIPFLKKLQRSKLISGVNWIPQVTRSILAIIILTGLMLIPSIGIKIGIAFALLNTIRILAEKGQRNTVYLDLVDDSIVKNERYKIHDPYNWNAFVNVVRSVDKLTKGSQQLGKGVVIVGQQFPEDDRSASYYVLFARLQIETMASIIELEEMLRENMLHSPASKWGKMWDKEAIHMEDLTYKMIEQDKLLEKLESELNLHYE